VVGVGGLVVGGGDQIAEHCEDVGFGVGVDELLGKETAEATFVFGGRNW